MVRRQTYTRNCRRIKDKQHPNNCYYCHQKRLMDSRSSILLPEERLLAAIFGEGRYFRCASEKIRQKVKINRRENARLLLKVPIYPSYPSPIYSWTDGSNLST